MTKRNPKKTFTLLSLVFGALMLLAVLYFLKPNLLIAWWLSWGLVTFGLYGYDKAQAKMGGGRVPEIVIHAFTMGGGFLGAWAGRFLFHHKTRKPLFLIILLTSTGIWLGLGYVYFVGNG